jgi:hypothetical protein
MGSFWGVFWLSALVLAFVVAAIGASRRQRSRVDDPFDHSRKAGQVHGVKNLGSAPPATHHRMGRN